MPPSFATHYTNAKILGPDGQPWQDAEGVDRSPLPNVYLFNAVIGSYKSYLHGHQDDAMRNDPEFALAMPRDPHLVSLLDERVESVVPRRWEIQVGDKRNLDHKAIASSLKTIVENTPDFMSLNEYLLSGTVWAGRYGSKLVWGKKQMEVGDADSPQNRVVREAPFIESHSPVNGDKIGYYFDGTPYVQVNSAFADKIPQAEVGTTTYSRGLLLKGTWRRNFIIHKHKVRDADFRSPDQADMIHGVGIRHFLFWLAYLKKNLLADIMQFVERTGLGVKLWKYQLGSKQSEDEVTKAASESSDQTNLIIPVSSATGRPVEGVEILDTSAGGAVILERLIKIFDDWTERFVVGQTLSGGTGDSGLNGSGVADFHANTKFNKIAFDSINLDETFTRDMVRPLLAWTFPKFRHLPARFVRVLANPNVTEILNAASAYYELGGTIVEDELRDTIGFSEPQEGDKVLSLAQAMQQQAQQMQQMQPQGGQQQPQEADYASVLKQLTGEPKANGQPQEEPVAV